MAEIKNLVSELLASKGQVSSTVVPGTRITRELITN